MKEIVNKIREEYLSLNYGYDFENESLDIIIYHLLNNGWEEQEVLNYIFKYGTVLDESLWNNSLLSKDVFYYHNELKLLPKAAIWRPGIKEKTNKFFLEMRISFTMDDLLEYYYKELNIPVELRDGNKDTGGFKYLINKYNNKFKIEAIDFILFLIDYNKQENTLICNVLDVQKYEREVYDKINYIVENSIYKTVVWRGAK